MSMIWLREQEMASEEQWQEGEVRLEEQQELPPLATTLKVSRRMQKHSNTCRAALKG